MQAFKGGLIRDSKGHFIKESPFLNKRVMKINTLSEADEIFSDWAKALKRFNFSSNAYLIGELIGKGGIVKKYHS